MDIVAYEDDTIPVTGFVMKKNKQDDGYNNNYIVKDKTKYILGMNKECKFFRIVERIYFFFLTMLLVIGGQG